MEPICFELENITLNYLDQEILKINRLAVHQFDRIGIVGKNGVGKSTLLKLLAKKIEPTKGLVKSFADFGYFEQINPPKGNDVDRNLFGKLRIPDQSSHLSGGEQTRLKLAKLFSDYHQALLIDEPTTHLDHEGRTFFLDELRYYYGALILISHDRFLLDQLVTTIWEIEDGQVTVYSGNYSDYQQAKTLEREQQNQAHQQFIKERSRLERAAQEKMFKAKKVAEASRMSKREVKAKANRMFETKSKGTSEKGIVRSAKAIEQRIEQLEQVDAVQMDRSLVFHQPESLELHNKFPIMADRITVCVGQKELLKDVSFQFPLDKKIAITGSNGCGKSTLLKYIIHQGAGLTISPKAKFGYFEQMSYQFSSDETVLDFLKNRSDYDVGFLRTVLHSMLFVGTDIRKNVRSLSGGEAIRLQLCQLFLGKYNILLLDEPTNFLDVEAIEALERVMISYQGTILFVTHDQRFIENVADRTYEISNKSLIEK